MFNLSFHSLLLQMGITHHPKNSQGDRGFSLIELIMVLAVAGVLAAMVVPAISFATRSLTDSTRRLAGSFTMARAKAMSQTSAYRIRPTGVSPEGRHTFIVERSSNCKNTAPDDWRMDGVFSANDSQLDGGIEFSAAFEDGVSQLATSGWSLCFNGRGLANKNLRLTLLNTKDRRQQEIEVFTGGAVQVYEN